MFEYFKEISDTIINRYTDSTFSEADRNSQGKLIRLKRGENGLKTLKKKLEVELSNSPFEDCEVPKPFADNKKKERYYFPANSENPDNMVDNWKNDCDDSDDSDDSDE